jgi:hypothetical protein
MDEKGILFSQVGYDIDKQKKLFIRGPKNFLSKRARIKIIDKNKKVIFNDSIKFIGDFWKINWWTIDFTKIKKSGIYEVVVFDKGKGIFNEKNLRIGKDILFERCVRYVGAECLKKRVIFARVKPGWFDAGYLWQEVCSHSMMIVGLTDLMSYAANKLPVDLKEEVLVQIKGGCKYLEMCNDEAKKQGHGQGAFIHDLARMKDCVTPNDSFMGAIAFIKSAEIIKQNDREKAKELFERAIKILNWIYTKAKPLTANNHPYNQGFPENAKYPNQWMTRYLMLALWAEIIIYDNGYKERMKNIKILSEKILKRQIKRENAEFGLWGHFYAYDNCDISEKAWSHGMPPKDKNGKIKYGSDMGAVFVHPVFAFLEGIKRIKEKELLGKWEKALNDFIFNYFKPVCEMNPFKILPRGIFGKEGPIWFAGSWHGNNSVFGQAAALAMEFFKYTGENAFKDIAYSNLQWICGLNCGLTKKAMEKGCVIFNTDLKDGIAYPVSMIKGVGDKDAGNWTNIRGSICNGFGTGKQFRYDVPPKAEFDTPEALHDEDWITHNGGFLMGLARI